MDDSHLSLGGGQTTRVHPALSALPLALGAWMEGFLFKKLLQLQFVRGQHTQQDQDQVRTRMAANQGRVWRMKGKV